MFLYGYKHIEVVNRDRIRTTNEFVSIILIYRLLISSDISSRDYEVTIYAKYTICIIFRFSNILSTVDPIFFVMCDSISIQIR